MLCLLEKLKERLKGYGAVALAIDGWEDHMKMECVGVTAHPLKGSGKPLLLDIERQFQRQSADVLNAYLGKIIKSVEEAGYVALACTILQPSSLCPGVVWWVQWRTIVQ